MVSATSNDMLCKKLIFLTAKRSKVIHVEAVFLEVSKFNRFLFFVGRNEIICKQAFLTLIVSCQGVVLLGGLFTGYP